MFDRYTIGGFVAALVVWATVQHLVTSSSTVKVLLRRLVLEVVLLGAGVALAVWIGSDPAFKVWFGAVAYFALNWAWTALGFGYVGFRWLFANTPAADGSGEETAEVSPLAVWKKSADGADFAVRFDIMKMEIDSDLSDLDGGTLYDLDKEAKETWKEEHKKDGWTEQEWMDYAHHEYEIRRTNDGTWQTRFTYKYWTKEVQEAQKALTEGGIGSWGAEEKFKRLLGYTWEQWQNRKTVPLPEGDNRPWQNIADDYAPEIETAYQRYIHQG